MVNTGNVRYQSFLVRCRLIPPAAAGEPAAWRFELREVSAEPQVYRFSDLTQLTAFMAAKLTAVAAANNPDGDKNISV